MAGGVRLSRWAWPGVAALLAAGSAGAWWIMDAQGAASWGWYAEPHPLALDRWRWWTAALVHVNSSHLQANLWAALVTAAWGWAARAGATQALAWLLAWPLSTALLATDPGSMSRYVGLSATLHAGAVIVCGHLVMQARGARRAVGAVVAVAIAIKLALEVPWLQAWWQGGSALGQVLSPLPDAPGHVRAGHAHGCGVVAGLVAAVLVDGIMALSRRRLWTARSPAEP